jgi:hypothetical protein
MAAGLGAKALAMFAVPPERWSAALWSWCDDLAVAVVIGLLLWRAGRWFAVCVAGAVVGYLALNVLVVRALGAPLTAAMLRGFDPAMADSATHALAPAAMAGAAIVAGLGCGAGWLASRVGLPGRARSAGALAGLGALAALVCLCAPAPQPAHRNACFALLRSLLPRALPPAPADEPGAPAAERPAEGRATRRARASCWSWNWRRGAPHHADIPGRCRSWRHAHPALGRRLATRGANTARRRLPQRAVPRR